MGESKDDGNIYSFKQYPVTGQEVIEKKKIQEVPIKPKNCKNGQRLEQAALRGCKFSFLEDTENTIGQRSEEPALVDSTLST